MKGFVPTPLFVVDLMVAKLFKGLPPASGASVLDPGCGNGEFIEGVLRACQVKGWGFPRIVGVELDPLRADMARKRFQRVPQVEIRHADFLEPTTGAFDFIVGNPPYVPIAGLSIAERVAYREAFRAASGRFDLYALFFEQALRLLAPTGRLVFITPEKYLYVETARPLRDLLCKYHVEELHLVGEATFRDRVTYPLISTVTGKPKSPPTRVIGRDGRKSAVRISGSASWRPLIDGFVSPDPGSTNTLAHVAQRISCGVATGADSVFVVPTSELTPDLKPFAFQTVSGRQILPTQEVVLRSSLLMPYDDEGHLLPEDELGALGQFLSVPSRRRQLERRTCVERKPWYAFHDSVPITHLLRPKLICKDITEQPFFVVDRLGDIVPRHSVYYVVPADPSDLEALAEYLNSPEARSWLRAHCQRAANGFLRLQSHVLKRLPLPSSFQPRVGALATTVSHAELLPA